MAMSGWKAELDRSLACQRADIPEGKGAASRKSADEKADREYAEYQGAHHEAAAVDKDYFRALSRGAKRVTGSSE